MSEKTCDSVKTARLSMAFADVVGASSALHEGSYFGTEPLGERIAVQIPEAQWKKLSAAIRSITGGDDV